jgi:hypothetical protein
LKSFLIAAATICTMFAIVPLMVWGGTGDWRHALTALRQYLKIIGALVVIGGGFGLIVSCQQLIG